MPKYTVLITCQEYVEIEADNANDASWIAMEEYKNGYLEIDPYFEFVCEECDRLEEENA
jgi:hypothetical protein